MNPLVSVIVPHHLDENAPYLKLCLDSILASQTEFSFEVICIADTKEPVEYINNPTRNPLITWHRPDLNSATKKINWGAVRARGKYLWLISDDVMVSKYAMRSMVEAVGDKAILCNPMSNSDNGSQFVADLGVPLKLSHEEIISDPFSYLEFAAEINCTPKPLLIPVRQFIAFYCTMIPKAVWNLVGDLDERMDVRGNDWDYCIRAAKQGVPPMINLGAFALHFGDKSLPKCTTPEMYAAADEAFREKYAIRT